MTMPNFAEDWRPWLAERAREIGASIAFLTRLPLPRAAPVGGTAHGEAELAQAVWAFPLAGLVVGVFGAGVYALALRLGLTSWPAAGLAVTTTLLLTGALHEDGLADTADGFGGGTTREQKLEIMRDARIGAYGVCALALSILLRVSTLADLTNVGAVVAALIAAHVGARAAMPVVMFLVAPARSDGLSFAAGAPSAAGVAIGAVLGFLILLLCLGPASAILALVAVAIVVAFMAPLSVKQIGGQTGDVLGAVEQVSEIAILLVALR
jgi:adenosylcobinamide-GDP ribazoletransferase